MDNIEELYQFSLIVEEKLDKKFDYKNSGRGHGGRSSGQSYSGHNDDQKNKDEAGSSSHNQRENDFNHFHDQKIDIREEAVEDKDLEEEAFVGF